MLRRSYLLLALLLLSACGSQPPPRATAFPASIERLGALPSGTVSRQVATPTPQLTPRPACLSLPGRVEKGQVEHPDLVRPLPFRVYLPACAGQPGFERLPTIYLLHGLAQDDSQWEQLGALSAADEMIAAGQAPPFILVLPWERTGIDLEVAITQALLPHIEATYPAASGRQNRAIGGLSRGGGWALRIGMKHPQLFGSIGLHSPAVLSPDLFYLAEWREAQPMDSVPRVALDVGDHDPLQADAHALAEALGKLGLLVEVTLNSGEHLAGYWAEHVHDYLEWYVAPWRAEARSGRSMTPAPEDDGSCPCAE